MLQYLYKMNKASESNLIVFVKLLTEVETFVSCSLRKRYFMPREDTIMAKLKKLTALLMTVILAASLAGCGGDTEEDTTQGTTQGTTQAEATTEGTDAEDPTESADAEDDKYPAFDMGGRTIRVAMWWDRYYDSGDTDVNDNPSVTNVEQAQMQLDNLRRIEDKYNAKLEFVNLSWNGMIESINTSIAAGNPEFDIYTIDLQFGVSALANGLALPIESYASATSDVMTDNLVMKKMELLGDYYLFQEQGLQNGGVLGFNADLLNELGLENPQDLYDRGEWDWDTFREYCIAATQDTDGDGVDDQWGYGGVYGTSMGFLYANNGVMADGPEEKLSSPEVVETYNFLDQLYNVDKCAKYFSGTDDDWNANLYGWANGNILFWGAAAWSLKAGVDNYGADFEYHVVPFPTGPSGDGSAYGAVGGNWYMIPVGTENPEQVYQFFEEYTNWFDYDQDIIFDKSTLEPYFLSERDIDYAVMTGEKVVVDFVEKVGFDLGTFHQSIITGEMTVSQAIESNKQLLQEKLDAVFQK